MNKAELAGHVAEDARVSYAAAYRAVTSVFTRIEEALAQGDKTTIVNFGRFYPVERAARTGYNPQTGESIAVPSKTVARFHPGKHLRDSVKYAPAEQTEVV